jgi:TonB-linked SusC/RagA family outer membrane protein
MKQMMVVSSCLTKLQYPIIALFLLLGHVAQAQQTTIKGTVKDGDDLPLINTTVYIKNKIEQGYVNTSYDGRFEIKGQRGDTLIVSCIGYVEKRLAIEERVIDVVLERDKLEVKVVTGLGISRSEQELGYAIQSITDKKIQYSKTHNFIQSLNGRITGTQIKSSSAGPTSTTSMVIRGETTISGRNQPLFVLNGMPMTNNLFSLDDGLNGSSTIDFGNAAQVIGVDDIQSISILRGASAAIAYGSRAANGVVLITTKNAQGRKEGWSASINSTTTLETILKMPDFQNEYGFGGYGKYSYLNGSTYEGIRYDAFGENWGPRLDGQLVKQWNTNGEATPYLPTPNNIRDFYRIGVSSINNVSVFNGGENGHFRLSFSSLLKEDIVPNSDLHRTTMLASFGQKIGEKMKLEANAFYTLSGSKNIASGGYDESSSILYGWLWFPRNANIDDFKSYWKPGLEGSEQNYAENLWVNNPWFLVNENTNSFLANRFAANATMNFDILKGWTARVKGGADVHNETRVYQRAYSTRRQPFGSYETSKIEFAELNIEALTSYRTNEKKPFVFTGTLVFNMMRQQGLNIQTRLSQLSTPGVYNLSNVRGGVETSEFNYNKGIDSWFGITSLSYKKMLHLELAGRNDAYSTLNLASGAIGDGSFYPSATLSAVLTEMFKVPVGSILNFAKLRIGFGAVLADQDPYLLENYYEYDNNWNNASLLGLQPTLNNPNLVPERTESFEAGVEARLFDNRLSLDVTFFNVESFNLIARRPLPVSSGYAAQVTNSGRIRNRGLEFSVSATPIKLQQFSWTVELNSTRMRSLVLSLGGGLTSFPIVADMFPGDAGSDLSLEAQVGKPYGQLVGLGFQRDGDGNIIHEDGLPLLTSERVSAGSYQPDGIFGLANTIRYKNFELSFLLSGQFGGRIYSRTHAMLNTGGSITNYDDPNLNLSTLDGREEYDITYNSSGDPVYTLTNAGDAGVVAPGVMYDAQGDLVPNTVKVNTRDYFYAYYGNGFNRDNIEAATFDATYLKLKEVRLTYNFPSKLLEKAKIKAASISFVGRNLFLFSAVPTIDPETFSIRNNHIIQGFESGQFPPTRSFSINLQVKF